MSEKIITSLSIIAQRSQRNEVANIRFRTRVKRSNLPGNEIDTIVDTTAREVEAGIDCETCANCCRTLQIVVDDQDIRKLAAYLGLSSDELERRYVKRAPDGVKHFSKTPCVFLDGNSCSVYEARPTACRDFPYLHSPGFQQRTWMMLDNAARCPIAFNTLERLKRKI